MLRKLPALDIEGPPLADPKQWHVKVDGLVKARKHIPWTILGVRPGGAHRAFRLRERLGHVGDVEGPRTSPDHRGRRTPPPEAGIPEQTKMKYGIT